MTKTRLDTKRRAAAHGKTSKKSAAPKKPRAPKGEGSGRTGSSNEAPQLLRLKYDTFDPKDGVPRLIRDESLVASPDSHLRVVQINQPITDAMRAELAERGVEIVDYLPDQAFVVSADPKAIAGVEKLPYVRAVIAMEPVFKVDPAVLARIEEPGFVEQPPQRYVLVATKGKQDQLEAAISALGGKVIVSAPGSTTLEAFLPPGQLKAALGLDSLMWLEPSGAPENDIDLLRVVSGCNDLDQVAPDRFTGRGVNMHIMEGIERTHVAFAAIPGVREAPIPVDDERPDSHGNSTAGEPAMNDPSNPRAKGVVPEVQLLYTNNQAVMNAPPGSQEPKSRHELTERLVNEHQVSLQTASWGYPRTKKYDGRSREMDEIVADTDLLIFQSQSNAGTRDSRPQAWSKNLVSVGAVKHYNNTNPGDDKWDKGASIGPAEDGRNKPDIAGPGYDKVFTTALNNRYTEDFGGTSAVTPFEASKAVKDLQMYAEGVFPGAPQVKPGGTVFENRPHAALGKALVIASAQQYPFKGLEHDLTRSHQGAGTGVPKYLYDNRDRLLAVNESEALKAGDSRSYAVTVEPGETELKAVLAWTDPPGDAAATKNLVNDLDLKVTSPDGTVYWGNVGLDAAMYSTPGGEPMNIDNVEKVFLKDPQPGEWKVEIIARGINMDGHKETPETDQDYGLVVIRAKAPADVPPSEG